MPQVINEDLHVAHNFWPTDLDHDGKLDIVVASFEGVSLLKRTSDGAWARTLIGEGNQKTSPSRGASEIKHGRLASGSDYLATIEPWHGFQVVVYTRPASAAANAAPASSPCGRDRCSTKSSSGATPCGVPISTAMATRSW